MAEIRMHRHVRRARVPHKASPLADRPRLNWPARLILLAELALLARMTVFQRGREDFLTVDAYALAEILLVAFVAGLVAYQWQPMTQLWRRLRGTAFVPLALFFGLAVLSTLWSPLPQYSGYRAGQFAALSVGLMLVLAATGSFAHAERVTMFSVLTTLGLGLFSDLVLRDVSIERFRGNQFGAGAALLTCYGFGEWLTAAHPRRKQLLFYAGVGLGLVYLSKSLASWWALLIGIVIALLLSRPGRAGLVGGVIAIGLLVAVWGADRLEPVIDPHGEIEKAETFSGRKNLWEEYAQVFKERPWLGLGYAVASRIAGPVYTTNTHNAAWAVLLGTGMVGFAVVLLAALRGFREAITACNAGRRGAVGAAAALVVGAANSMSISLFGECWGVAAFVFMLFVAFHLCAVVRPAWATAPRPLPPGAARRPSWKQRRLALANRNDLRTARRVR